MRHVGQPRFHVLIGHRDPLEVRGHLHPNEWRPGPVRKRVHTLADAQRVVRAFIDDTGSGGACLCDGFGCIEDDSWKILAHISYNGRAWHGTPEGWGTLTPEITGADLEKPLIGFGEVS